MAGMKPDLYVKLFNQIFAKEYAEIHPPEGIWLVAWLGDGPEVVRSIRAFQHLPAAEAEAWRLIGGLDPKKNFVLVWDLLLDQFVMSPYIG